MLEVCIDSLESAINAIHGGADELEVCNSLPEGGLTPSPGLVKEILKMMDNISCGKPIYKYCTDFCCKNIKASDPPWLLMDTLLHKNVFIYDYILQTVGCDFVVKVLIYLQRPKINIMIRCRGGSDFCYTKEEMDTMLSDIEYYKTLNIDRFVFGALKKTNHIDEESCQKIITAANPILVTFHRAFDMCLDPSFTLDRIIKLGFSRLLTSGQQKSASDPKSIDLLQKLLFTNEGRIEIMPGAGVNADNAKVFVNIGCKIIHSSCKCSKEINIKSELSMGTNSTEYIFYTDENIVRSVKEVLSKTVDKMQNETSVKA